MSERHPESDQTGEDIIRTRDYQSKSLELLYNLMDAARPGARISQPTIEEGRQTVELLPVNADDEPHLDIYETIGIILHPAGTESADGELLATVQLTQPPLEGYKEDESQLIEMLYEFRLSWANGKYCVEKEHMLFNYTLGIQRGIGDIDVADPDEIEALTQLIVSSDLKPLDI